MLDYITNSYYICKGIHHVINSVSIVQSFFSGDSSCCINDEQLLCLILLCVFAVLWDIPVPFCFIFLFIIRHICCRLSRPLYCIDTFPNSSETSYKLNKADAVRKEHKIKHSFHILNGNDNYHKISYPLNMRHSTDLFNYL